MPHVEWDPQHPPIGPPEGADPLIWELAHGLYRDHRAQSDGFCVTCREFWPCEPRGLAHRGFEAAFRTPGGGRAGSHHNPGDRY
jgi:hypothetical protein